MVPGLNSTVQRERGGAMPVSSVRVRVVHEWSFMVLGVPETGALERILVEAGLIQLARSRACERWTRLTPVGGCSSPRFGQLIHVERADCGTIRVTAERQRIALGELDSTLVPIAEQGWRTARPPRSVTELAAPLRALVMPMQQGLRLQRGPSASFVRTRIRLRLVRGGPGFALEIVESIGKRNPFVRYVIRCPGPLDERRARLARLLELGCGEAWRTIGAGIACDVAFPLASESLDLPTLEGSVGERIATRGTSLFAELGGREVEWQLCHGLGPRALRRPAPAHSWLHERLWSMLAIELVFGPLWGARLRARFRTHFEEYRVRVLAVGHADAKSLLAWLGSRRFSSTSLALHRALRRCRHPEPLRPFLERRFHAIAAALDAEARDFAERPSIASLFRLQLSARLAEQARRDHRVEIERVAFSRLAWFGTLAESLDAVIAARTDAASAAALGALRASFQRSDAEEAGVST